MSTHQGEKDIVLNGERISPLTVDFDSESPSVLKEVAGHHRPVRPIKAKAELFLPEGDLVGRPAVLVTHGLGGQKPVRELTYGAKLAKAGYVALVLDSFRSRNMDWLNDDVKAVAVTTWTLLADIFAGLRFLADHPAVNPKAISVMGFSWGGMTTVLAAYDQVRRAFVGERDELRFAGHAAYYGCSIPRLDDPTTTGAPVLVLLGEHDRNVSVERTREICDDMRRGGSEVDLRVFDAFHQWDGDDVDMRHVYGSLADLRLRITRDNDVLHEAEQSKMEGAISRVLMLLKNVDWNGYDIMRDEEVHRQSDQLLLEFLARVADREGAPPPEPGKVPLGTIARPAEERV